MNLLKYLTVLVKLDFSSKEFYCKKTFYRCLVSCLPPERKIDKNIKGSSILSVYFNHLIQIPSNYKIV